MKAIDFISESPFSKLTIFNKKRNKTNLGGFIVLFELISILLLIFIFLYDHINFDRYSIQYTSVFKVGADVKNTKDKIFERFDLNKNFTFELQTDYGDPLSDNFEIRQLRKEDIDGALINRTKGIKEKPSQFRVAIYYKCQNESYCQLRNEYNEETRFYFVFKINYDGFYIDHQFTNPIQNLGGKIQEKCIFSFETTTLTKLVWRNILYKEEEGMWSRIFRKLLKKEPKAKYLGYIESSNTMPINTEGKWHNRNSHKLLAIIEIENNIYNYIEYRRKENSIWVTFANILSLMRTINYCCVLFMSYYSKNYDNYNIIQFILSEKYNNNLIRNNLTNSTIEINKLKKASDNEINEKIQEPKIDKKEEIYFPLLKEDKNEKDLAINEVKNDIDINDAENYNYNNYEGAKISSFQFFMNHFYFGTFKKNKKQEIINCCNEIISKYLSIEQLEYNQILFENLLKDYRWNDSSLNNLKNNELIIKLNNLLS